MVIDGMLLTLTLHAQDVLGYSTLQFRLMTAAMTGMSIDGAYGGRELVTRLGWRPVAVAGMVTVAAGCLLFTEIPVEGSYVADLLPGLLVFGAGLGVAFVAAQIAVLSEVAEREWGLAAGLVDTSFSLGGAPASRSSPRSRSRGRARCSRGRPPPAELVAVTEGHQAALAVAAGLAALGALAAVTLLRAPKEASAGPAAPVSALEDRGAR